MTAEQRFGNPVVKCFEAEALSGKYLGGVAVSTNTQEHVVCSNGNNRKEEVCMSKKRNPNEYIGGNSSFVRQYEHYKEFAGFHSDAEVAEEIAILKETENCRCEMSDRTIRRYLSAKSRPIDFEFVKNTARVFGLAKKEKVMYFAAAGYDITHAEGEWVDEIWD